MEATDFMLQLARNLIAERSIAESTANAYLKVLYAMNDKKPFKNLTFLKSTDTMTERLGRYAESTQRAILGAIVSVLTSLKDKATFKKPYAYYHEQMMSRSKIAREEESKNTKSETQKANWIKWNDVEVKRNELLNAVTALDKKKSLSAAEYDTLLMLTVLSLYTEIQPRRNADFLEMYIVKKWNEGMEKDKNYLDLATKRFIFNKYKTAKKYGVQIEDIPERLWDRLTLFLRFHPLWKGHAKRALAPIKFLATADGSPMTAGNAITRVLNRIFGKKIGSSMLRHIFLSSKYGNTLEEMKRDGDAMAHSLSMQAAYIKHDTEEEKKASGAPTLVIRDVSDSESTKTTE